MNSPCIVDSGIRSQFLEGKNEEWFNFFLVEEVKNGNGSYFTFFFPIMNVQAVYEARRQQTYFPFNELKITVIGI